MAKERNVYHVLFAQLLQERAPPNFEIQTEVNLTSEPQRALPPQKHRASEVS